MSKDLKNEFLTDWAQEEKHGIIPITNCIIGLLWGVRDMKNNLAPINI